MTPLRPAQRATRSIASFVGALVGFVGLGGLIVWGLDASGQRYSTVERDVVRTLRAMLERQSSYEGPPRLVFLGDSLSMRGRGGNAAPEELRRLLKLRGGPDNPDAVLNVSALGLTAFSHYFASEQLTRLGADRFIIGVNLGWFSRGNTLQQPDLAGLLPPRRWAEATGLPLHEVGLSADEMVTAHAIMALGGMPTWQTVQREQVRVGNAVDRAGRAVQEALGAPGGSDYRAAVEKHRRLRRRSGKRPTALGADERWGPVSAGLAPDDPNLQVLDALVARLRASGARVLVMVSPTNVEVLSKLGKYDAEGFRTSMDRIREITARNEADFLDLHSLLPDIAFRDPTDHLDLRPPKSPQTHVAAQLVLWSEGRVDDWDQLLPEPPAPGHAAYPNLD